MPKVIYVTHSGETRTVEASIGMTVMRAAIANAIPGIDADCGGACACATCHVYVDGAWFDRLPAPASAEVDMLEFVMERQAHSRLSCQIDITADLDGLVVTTPASQN